MSLYNGAWERLSHCESPGGAKKQRARSALGSAGMAGSPDAGSKGRTNREEVFVTDTG